MWSTFTIVDVLLLAFLLIASSEHEEIKQLMEESSKQGINPKRLIETQTRVVIDNFISEQDALDLVKLGAYYEKDFKLIWKGYYHFKLSHPYVITSNDEKVQRLLRKAYEVSDKIVNFTKNYFNDPDLKLQIFKMALRKMPARRDVWNMSEWSHFLHSDSCTPSIKDQLCYEHQVYFDGGVNINSISTHTALLYLTESVGGHLTFVDLVGRKPYSEVRIKDFPPHYASMAHDAVHAEIMNSNSNPVGFTIPVATHTTVVNRPGTLAVFTSGPENMHAVTAMNGDLNLRRYSMKITFSTSAKIHGNLVASNKDSISLNIDKLKSNAGVKDPETKLKSNAGVKVLETKVKSTGSSWWLTWLWN